MQAMASIKTSRNKHCLQEITKLTMSIVCYRQWYGGHSTVELNRPDASTQDLPCVQHMIYGLYVLVTLQLVAKDHIKGHWPVNVYT